MQRTARAVSRRMARVLLCSLLAVVLVPLPASAQDVPAEPVIHYVDVAFEGTADGSMVAPFPTISQALEGARSGDTVIVAKGTYSVDSGERFPLWVGEGITLKSFSGSAETTIDAQFMSSAINVASVGGVSIDTLPEPAPVVIEGFSVTQGSAENGGCIRLAYAPDTTLRDLVISNGEAFVGGGVNAIDTDLTIENCEFLNNGFWGAGLKSEEEHAPDAPGRVMAEAGGALFLTGCSVSMSETTFKNNAAIFEGGAIYAFDTEILSVDCVAEGNMALNDATSNAMSAAITPELTQGPMSNGGFVHLSNSLAAFEGLLATGNMAFYGGAVSADWASLAYFGDASFVENMAYVGAGFYQGEMLSDQSVATATDLYSRVSSAASPQDYNRSTLFEQCLFAGNISYEASAIANEGAVSIRDSLFVENDDMGATISIGYGSTIEGSTIANNTTGMGAVVVGYRFRALPGSAVQAEDDAYLINSIVWGNEMTSRVEDSTAPAVIPQPFESDGSAVYGIYGVNSDIQGSFEGTACISTDPLFTDSEMGDYRLDVGSPCIDTGTFDTSSYIDLDGLLRPVDGDLDGSENYDMGAYESAGPRMARLAGETRYDTSAEVSAERFASSDVVVIATGRVFADGLSSAGLAGAYDAPLLLTGSDYLPAVIAAEIERLGATNAVLIGGTVAVEDVVKTDLEAMGLEVSRIGGADRYETAALVAEEIRALMGEEMSGVAFVARGDLYPDALAVSPVAYAMGAPILLVRPDELPASTIDVINEMGITSVVVAGGRNAVGVSVASDIMDTGAAIKRISGSDRYETAAMFAEYAVMEGWASYTVTGLSTGAAFPDALSGGAALGHVNGVMLLTPQDALSGFTADVLTARAEEIIYLRTLGGSAAVSAAVEAEAQALIE